MMDLLKNREKLCEQLQEEEKSAKQQLDDIISRHYHVEGNLKKISKILPSVVVIRGESEKFLQMVNHTNELAEKVSKKVRQLDLARSRVCECQSRVNDILDLQLCSQGVAAALKNEDYERGAAHVHRFLSMDQKVLERTAEDVSEDRTSIASSLLTLQEAADKLRRVVTHKFDESVKSEDLASVERFFKIFPLLGMEAEGLEKFCQYLCSKLQETAQKNLMLTTTIKANDKRAPVIFADTITLLFESIARIVDINQPIIETYYGPGKMKICIEILQRECDRQIMRIVAELMKQRSISKKIQRINNYSRKQGIDKIDPKEMDLLLGEITIMHARAVLYIKFLMKKISNDVKISANNENRHQDFIIDFEKFINNSELAKTMQELIGAYLALERYFLEESVNKAIGMDALDQEQQTSSMVDDVFFIVKKCIRRAISSWSIDGVCAVVNMACGILEGEFINRLKSRLRQGYPAGYMDLAHAYNAIQTSLQHGRLQTSDTEQGRLMFLAYLNNTDVSIEYIETLSKSLAMEINQFFPDMQIKEKGKVDSCLSGLKGITQSLRAVIDYGLEQLRASAVKPRVTSWVDAFLTINHHVNEEELMRYETDEPFVQTLILNLEELLQTFKDHLTTSNNDALIGIIASELTTRLEKVLLKCTFNRAGGLIFDKEMRNLSSYLASATSWSIRDKFARLMQIATILSIERVDELSDYCGADAIAWRLTPQEVRKIAELRIDFKSEDIRKLKL